MDKDIPDWSDDLVLDAGEVGEITVAGPTATDSYFNRDAATRAAKIREASAAGDERIVHRMGDVGYFDGEGRLWFCGRKTQRVETAAGPMYTEQVEPIFNAHAEVKRTALVGVGVQGMQTPVLCYEVQPGVPASRRTAIVDDLRAIATCHAHTAGINHFLCHPAFPVDIRHNAKIGREKLAAWAALQLEKAK